MPGLRGEPGDRAVPRMPGTHSAPELAGGGILINTGSHLLDGLTWIAGQPLVEVACRTATDDLPVETRAAVVGQLAGGAIVSLACEANAPGDWSWNERLTLYGSGGAVAIDWPPRPDALPQRTAHTGTPVVLSPADLPPGSNAMADFVDALLGVAPPAATGQEAMPTVRAVAACYRSAASGRPERPD
jgi:predicted dehydrogenase